MSEHVEPVTPADPPPPHPDEAPAPTPVEAAAEAARKAGAELREAEARAEKTRKEAAAAMAGRADKAEAAAPHWDIVHQSDTDMSERMTMPGGYLLRSSWRHFGDIGREPLVGSAVVFVPGDAPPLYEDGETLVFRLRDLSRPANPETATIEDVPPSPRIEAAGEVLLRMPDGSVRALRDSRHG